MNNVNDQTMKAANLFADKLSAKYPHEVQVGVGVIGTNFLNGCSWEFVRHNAEVERNKAAIMNNSNMDLHVVTYNHKTKTTGYLVSMNLNYLVSIYSDCAPGLIDKKLLDMAAVHRKEAIIGLANLMSKGYRDRIGIYCTNDSQSITVDGKTYPAFAVSLGEFLQLCNRYNYGVEASGSIYTPEVISGNAASFIKALTVAPSSNAIFVRIAPRQHR